MGRFMVIALIGLVLALVPIVLRVPLTRCPLHWFGSYSSKSSKDRSTQPKCLPAGEHLYTVEELAKFTIKPKILLGFLGVVYDVTSGPYYHPGGSYSFFAGRDGTRAFLTGEFTEPELRDDITDLDLSFFSGIDTWLGLYGEKYKRVGLVVGTYYDSNGCATESLARVDQILGRVATQTKSDDEENELYPACNSQWDGTTGQGSVWCSTMSGGVSRSWTGRPRLFYELNRKRWRCACVENDNRVDLCSSDPNTRVESQHSSGGGVIYDASATDNQPQCRFKHYPNCSPDATQCPIPD